MKPNFKLTLTALLLALGSAATHAINVEDIKIGTVIDDAAIVVKDMPNPVPFPDGRWQVTNRLDDKYSFGSRYSEVPWIYIVATRIDEGLKPQVVRVSFNLETGRFAYSGSACSPNVRKPEVAICNDFGYQRSQLKSLSGSVALIDRFDASFLTTNKYLRLKQPNLEIGERLLDVTLKSTKSGDLTASWTFLTPVSDSFSLSGDNKDEAAIAQINSYLSMMGAKLEAYYGGFLTRGEFFKMPTLEIQAKPN